MNRAYSEFFDGCCKAIALAELDIVEATLTRMHTDLTTARRRLDAPGKAEGDREETRPAEEVRTRQRRS
jgi:hypothetical protein